MSEESHLNLPQRIHRENSFDEIYLGNLFNESAIESLQRRYAGINFPYEWDKLGYESPLQLSPTKVEGGYLRVKGGAELGSTFKLRHDECVTQPKIELIWVGNGCYSAYNLNGLCSCGKPYYEHPEFVKENERRKYSFLASESEMRNSPNDLSKTSLYDKMLKKLSQFI